MAAQKEWEDALDPEVKEKRNRCKEFVNICKGASCPKLERLTMEHLRLTPADLRAFGWGGFAQFMDVQLSISSKRRNFEEFVARCATVPLDMQGTKDFNNFQEYNMFLLRLSPADLQAFGWKGASGLRDLSLDKRKAIRSWDSWCVG